MKVIHNGTEGILHTCKRCNSITLYELAEFDGGWSTFGESYMVMCPVCAPYGMSYIPIRKVQEARHLAETLKRHAYPPTRL